MTPHPVIISGTCQRLLFSPKGGIEGALVETNDEVVQVVVDPDRGAELLEAHAPGTCVRVLAVADHSPKTKAATHPVYRFEAFVDAQGKPRSPAEPGPTTLEGVVAALHYARHGEPNGVILEGGEFIHLRPHGMARLGLEVGSHVTAAGEVRDTVLGTRMMAAQNVNHVDLG